MILTASGGMVAILTVASVVVGCSENSCVRSRTCIRNVRAAAHSLGSRPRWCQVSHTPLQQWSITGIGFGTNNVFSTFIWHDRRRKQLNYKQKQLNLTFVPFNFLFNKIIRFSREIWSSIVFSSPQGMKPLHR